MIMTLRPPKFFECASRDDSFVVSFGAVSLNDLPHVISQLNAISASESQIHKKYRHFLPSEKERRVETRLHDIHIYVLEAPCVSHQKLSRFVLCPFPYISPWPSGLRSDR